MDFSGSLRQENTRRSKNTWKRTLEKEIGQLMMTCKWKRTLKIVWCEVVLSTAYESESKAKKKKKAHPHLCDTLSEKLLHLLDTCGPFTPLIVDDVDSQDQYPKNLTCSRTSVFFLPLTQHVRCPIASLIRLVAFTDCPLDEVVHRSEIISIHSLFECTPWSRRSCRWMHAQPSRFQHGQGRPIHWAPPSISYLHKPGHGWLAHSYRHMTSGCL